MDLFSVDERPVGRSEVLDHEGKSRFKPGDEILTTTQDYPRMLTTLRQREKRENLKLKLIQIPIPAKNLNEITAAFEKGITDRTRLILISHMINITGQITPVKAVCDLARARGIETRARRARLTSAPHPPVLFSRPRSTPPPRIGADSPARSIGPDPPYSTPTPTNGHRQAPIHPAGAPNWASRANGYAKSR